jgi:hypothetical protein
MRVSRSWPSTGCSPATARSSVSHDLRTPLAAITASIGVVLSNEPRRTPPALHRLLVNIDQAADDMGALVEALLELTRLQAGRVELRRGSTDLREVALRAVRQIEPLAQARGQKIELDLPPEAVAGDVDTQRLDRVLLNLLGNAARYGREQARIYLRLEDNRIDLFRAMHLAGIRDEVLLQELIGVAPEYGPEAFDALVQQRVASSNTVIDRDERRLALVAERLARVETITPAAVEHLQRIVHTASALLERGSTVA